MQDRTIDNAIASGKTYGDPAFKDQLFKRLREEEPVRWTQPDGFRPFWTVTRHADVTAIERQHERFVNEPRERLNSIEFETKVKELMQGRKHLVQSMHAMDGGKHKMYRQITAAWFMPKQLKSLEERITALTTEAIDNLRKLGPELDFKRDVATWYPLKVIMLILGLPDADAPHLQKLTSSYFGGDDPEMLQGSDVISAAQAFRAYFDVVAAHRRAQPTDDVASLIANAVVDGRPIEQYESSSYYIALAAAGHDTTSASIAGGLLALIENPDQWRKLQEHPELMPSAVDEMLRWVTPIHHFFRNAVADCEIRGQQIKAGDALMMVFPSANRDEEVFEDPYSFRIDRTPNKQVAFGYGVHMCLGMMLAKLEMQIFFRELLKRVAHVELTGEPQWVETNFVGGLKRLPVRVVFKS